MALTDPPSGLHPGPGYDDTPAGNIWRQAAGPTTPDCSAGSLVPATGTGG